MHIKNVLRDMAFVFFLSYWGGFVFSYMDTIFGVENKAVAFAFVSYLVSFCAFLIIAYWSEFRERRKFFAHMSFVAMLVWLSGTPDNLILGNVKIWLVNGILLQAIALCVVLIFSCVSSLARKCK